MTEETKGNLALYGVLGFMLVGVVASLEPAAAVGPAILLIIWMCQKVKVKDKP